MSRAGDLAMAAAFVVSAVGGPASAYPSPSLEGQVLLGYQAWFDCPEQGGAWSYWALPEGAAPTPTTLRVDLYPDLSECKAEDLCPAEGFSTGGREETAGRILLDDWKYLVDSLQVTYHPGNVRQGGLPEVSVWGPGYGDRPPANPAADRAFYMGGVPEGWRSLTGASRPEAGWREVYDAMDALQPWTVGRFSDSAGADAFRRNFLTPDMAEARSRGKLYMPVVFPGFSWKNLKGGAGEITAVFHGSKPLVPTLPLDPSRPRLSIRRSPFPWRWPARVESTMLLSAGNRNRPMAPSSP